MNTFLLSPAVLLELLASAPNVSKQWFQQEDVRQMRLDSVSVGLVLHTIAQVGNPWTRSRLATQFAALSQVIQNATQPPLDFGARHAPGWAQLLSHPVLIQAGSDAATVQTYAIAQLEGLTFVELQAYVPAGLQNVGIQYLAL